MKANGWMAPTRIASNNTNSKKIHGKQVSQMVAYHLPRRISFGSKQVVKRVSRVRRSRSLVIICEHRIPQRNELNAMAKGAVIFIVRFDSNGFMDNRATTKIQ